MIKILSLPITKSVVADFSQSNSITTWTGSQTFLLTDYDYDAIIKYNPVKIRIETEESYEDFNIKENGSNNLKELLACIK